MAKKTLLKERGTDETLYPVTPLDCIVDFPKEAVKGQVLTYDGTKPIWSKGLTEEVMLDTLTYGVAWKPNVADPNLTRVGNPTYHKTLPIQSGMKGCIYDSINKKLIKWLNPNNWSKRSSYDSQYSIFTREAAKFRFNLGETSDIFIEGEGVTKRVGVYNAADFNERYKTIFPNYEVTEFPEKYDGKLCISFIDFTKFFPTRMEIHTEGIDINPVGLKGVPITIINGDKEYTYKVLDVVLDQGSIPYNSNTSFSVATIVLDVNDIDFIITELQSLMMNSTEFRVEECLNGYYGEVMVYVPEFYIRSWDEPDRREVRISQTKIDDTWEHQPALFIGAYKETVLNITVNDMAYLSVLTPPAAISVNNSNTYCAGGSSNTLHYDSPILCRRNTNKGKTSVPRATFRNYVRASKKEILSYRQYKNIIYWLWVIEYANFNSQAAYNPELTSEGFRQGGMGTGLTTMSYWSEFNGYNPVCPNGFTDEFGNNTGVKDLVIPRFDITVPAINDLSKVKINAANGTLTDGKVTVTNITSTSASIMTCAYNSTSVKTTYKITGLTASGEILRFETGSGSSVNKVAEISADGNIEVTWPDTMANREFRFSEVKSGVNIVIEVVSSEAGIVYANEQTVRPFRWRGIENTFGDTWNNVDGIVIDADADNHPDNMNYVYTTNDSSKYGDTVESTINMELSGYEIHTEGYIKEWNLGTKAEIIPRLNGANSTQYKSDYHYVGVKDKSLRALFLGGSADHGGLAGLGCFLSDGGVGAASAYIGFRSVCETQK